jgi:pSer/pThr/pTyr-binding forkhead associated (FHA) protein
MSELALNVVRLGFLALLWFAVIAVLVILARDMRAPREVRTATGPAPSPTRARRERPAGSKRWPHDLVVVDGPMSGTRVPLDGGPILIGRVPESTLVLDDEFASNRHARLVLSDTGWVLEDLGSTNGTWIRNTRLTAPAPVDAGSRFRIGSTTFELRR